MPGGFPAGLPLWPGGHRVGLPDFSEIRSSYEFMPEIGWMKRMRGNSRLQSPICSRIFQCRYPIASRISARVVGVSDFLHLSSTNTSLLCLGLGSQQYRAGELLVAWCNLRTYPLWIIDPHAAASLCRDQLTSASPLAIQNVASGLLLAIRKDSSRKWSGGEFD